jgi:hypothetical protein
MNTPNDRRCFRVWMADGYCCLVVATSDADARKKAVGLAERACDGAAMSAAERRRALRVKNVEDLANDGGGVRR